MKKLFQLFMKVDIVDVLLITVIPIVVLMIVSFVINKFFNNKFSINLVNFIDFLVMILFSILIPKLFLFTFTATIKLLTLQHFEKLLSISLIHGVKISFFIFILVPIGIIMSTVGFLKDTMEDNAICENYLNER